MGASAQSSVFSQRRSVARWRAPSAVAAVFGGLLLGQLIALAILDATGRQHPSGVVVGLALAAADVVMVAIVLVVAARGADHLAPSTLGIRRVPFGSALGWTVAMYFAILAAEVMWVALVGSPNAERAHHRAAIAPGLATLFAAAVIAPIVEEVMFRGYLFPTLTRWRGPWIGATLTALLFGVAHFAVYPLEFLPALAFFGFGACLLFWLTRSLLPCIGLHAFNNGLVIAGGLHWGAAAALAGFAAPIVAIGLLLPFAPRLDTPQPT